MQHIYFFASSFFHEKALLDCYQRWFDSIKNFFVDNLTMYKSKDLSSESREIQSKIAGQQLTQVVQNDEKCKRQLIKFWLH